MSAQTFNADTVQKRLISLKRILNELSKYNDVEKTTLTSNASLLYAVFFMLSQTVDLATDINQHIGKAALGLGSEDTGRGFNDLIRAGILPGELETDFHRSSALRNVITHQYVEVDLDILVQAIPMSVQLYGSYIQHVGQWLENRS